MQTATLVQKIDSLNADNRQHIAQYIDQLLLDQDPEWVAAEKEFIEERLAQSEDEEEFTWEEIESDILKRHGHA